MRPRRCRLTATQAWSAANPAARPQASGAERRAHDLTSVANATDLAGIANATGATGAGGVAGTVDGAGGTADGATGVAGRSGIAGAGVAGGAEVRSLRETEAGIGKVPFHYSISGRVVEPRATVKPGRTTPTGPSGCPSGAAIRLTPPSRSP